MSFSNDAYLTEKEFLTNRIGRHFARIKADWRSQNVGLVKLER